MNIGSMHEYGEKYAASDSYGGGISYNWKGIIMYNLSSIFCFIVLNLLNYSNERNKDKKLFEFCSKILILYIYISIFSNFIVIFFRFLNYFLPIVYLSMSILIFSKVKINNNKYKFSFIIWLMFFFPQFYSSIIEYKSNIGDSNYKYIVRYYPYSSILNPVKDLTRENYYMK